MYRSIYKHTCTYLHIYHTQPVASEVSINLYVHSISISKRNHVDFFATKWNLAPLICIYKNVDIYMYTHFISRNHADLSSMKWNLTQTDLDNKISGSHLRMEKSLQTQQAVHAWYTSPVQLFLTNKNHLPDSPLNPTPSSSAGEALPLFSASSSSSSSTELMCSSCRTLK